jgi:cytochrome c551/c552
MECLEMTISSMGKISTILCLFLLIAGPASAVGKKGEVLFLSMKCSKCHTTEGNPKGPSLPRIADAYGDVSKLLLFFQGESEPIVEPARAKTMKPRRRRIKKLSSEDQKALAKYVIGFKSTP